MDISTWILIITLLLGILFIVISSFLSSTDQSKKSAKTGLTRTSIVCFVLAAFIGVYKFMTREKGVAKNGNGNGVKTETETVNSIKKQIEILQTNLGKMETK
jgi:hypothetical protein